MHKPWKDPDMSWNSLELLWKDSKKAWTGTRSPPKLHFCEEADAAALRQT